MFFIIVHCFTVCLTEVSGVIEVYCALYMHAKFTYIHTYIHTYTYSTPNHAITVTYVGIIHTYTHS